MARASEERQSEIVDTINAALEIVDDVAEDGDGDAVRAVIAAFALNQLSEAGYKDDLEDEAAPEEDQEEPLEGDEDEPLEEEEEEPSEEEEEEAPEEEEPTPPRRSRGRSSSAKSSGGARKSSGSPRKRSSGPRKSSSKSSASGGSRSSRAKK